MGAPEVESARRAELLELLVEYSKTHGLSSMSLRPLAAAVGSSPRVLLYFFGSKDGLIREVHGRLRREQLELVARSAHSGRGPVESVRVLWKWLANPANADVERLFFECYARSLRDPTGPWARFGEAGVREWLPHIARLLHGGSASPTLVLAALRGLLLDLLATGDRDRVQRAFGELLLSIVDR
ncbi:MAG TPA: TetR/AcrR family transcriptional regulator [Actinophytocola sp.]|uniref:TetR/AcrR family transcriptional regulator n=1 Tax=Actinophytocola sp. TaxID=1872138 RepID=UPI002DDD0005|nr:TetR/AcrR family transcriptional regulator [Actinophytocola sp.]HEV2778632.1 TetR/AcrR family transcriptional regulator [Actinophytocola sp.]